MQLLSRDCHRREPDRRTPTLEASLSAKGMSMMSGGNPSRREALTVSFGCADCERSADEAIGRLMDDPDDVTPPEQGSANTPRRSKAREKKAPVVVPSIQHSGLRKR
jgi:hypothetical protein